MGMVDYSERFNAGNGGKLVTEVVRGRDKQTRNTHAQSVWHTTAKHAHIELRLWYTVRATARTLALVRKRKCPSGAERGRTELTESVELTIETGTSVRNATRTTVDATRHPNNLRLRRMT